MGRVTRFGLTWWGQRWIATLEAMGTAYANRLPRGRTYARKGTVADLVVNAGEVTALVAGSRPRPYRVRLIIPTFSDDQWSAAVAALAGQLRHAAALLDGRMPDDVDDVFAQAGVSLFPNRRELATTCSCPDEASPCKHVAAVHYVLAQTFDTDPFLLPTLRGRNRDTLLAELRGVRSGSAPVQTVVSDGANEGFAVRDLNASTLYTARGDLAAIAAHPQAPVDPTATVRRLGAPPGVLAAAQDPLVAAVAAAADHAWRLASESDVDNPLLAALVARGTATAAELGAELGWSATQVRAGLRELIDAGLAHRTGHARGTRYHA